MGREEGWGWGKGRRLVKKVVVSLGGWDEGVGIWGGVRKDG